MEPNDEVFTTEQETAQSQITNVTAIQDMPSHERKPAHRNLSQRALAETVVREKHVHHVPGMGVFMVEGSKGDKYAVSLFPKEKCQCPSTNLCYHILAAQLSIGMPPTGNTKTINLSQLRRNSRKRVDKKGGRKTPRKLDYENSEVIPAPDSSYVFDLSQCGTSGLSVVEGTPPPSSAPPSPSVVPILSSTPNIRGKGKKVTFKDRETADEVVVEETLKPSDASLSSPNKNISEVCIVYSVLSQLRFPLNFGEKSILVP